MYYSTDRIYFGNMFKSTYSCVRKASTIPVCPSKVLTHLYVVNVSQTWNNRMKRTTVSVLGTMLRVFVIIYLFIGFETN